MEEIYEDKFSRFMQFVIGLPTETTEIGCSASRLWQDQSLPSNNFGMEGQQEKGEHGIAGYMLR